MKSKHLGYVILISSLIILFSLYLFNSSINKENKELCERLCLMENDISCSVEACLFNLNNAESKRIFYLIGLFVSFIGGIGFYISFSREERIIKNKNYDLSKLSKEEKEVFLFIKHSEDKNLYQSNIKERFNFPKSKVTRLLDKLEKQDLIERKRRGMSNLIVIK